jgi:UDP-GlcNAc:undecaprenyl-phosphate/decaprenyl-phosphate GlcNAc-1-phosphate transferase
MTQLILLLCSGSFIITFAATFVMRRLAPAIGFVDKPGARKIHVNPKPLGGGVAIFLGLALPMLIGLSVAHMQSPPIKSDILTTNLDGIRAQTPGALIFLGCALAVHILGLFDDRKAMGPFVKLFIQLGITAFMVWQLKLGALTALGPVVSFIVTVLWIGGITNAFNFLDNMDGLSAGVAAVCTTAFLITALSIQQWFVSATLALLLGSLIGFLCHNFPPAKIFMGDSGSLLIGFVLGTLTVRTTYLRPGQDFAAGWYVIFAPMIVLAVPLYDFVVVSIIRLGKGKSPFVGDTNHFSHRLVRRGMSKMTAVLCIYLIAAATSVAAIILTYVDTAFAAMLIFGQTLLVLGVVALLEQHPLPTPPEFDNSHAKDEVAKGR